MFFVNIARPSRGVKLLGGPVGMVFEFCSKLVMKIVDNSIKIMVATNNYNDPQYELLLLRAWAGVPRLYFAMRKCPLVAF